jgi:protein TonB
MTARELHWLDDRDPRNIVRWLGAAAVVVGLYGALIAGYLVWHQPSEEIGDLTPVVTVDLAPIDSVADAHQRDIAPGPEDMVEQSRCRKWKNSRSSSQRPRNRHRRRRPQPTLRCPNLNRRKRSRRSARPLRARRPASKVARRGSCPSWQADLVRHLQQYKRYPSGAQGKREQGVVLLGFSVDRNGRVLARRIVQSSGHADLDQEVMDMIVRAQPLPAFPASMTQSELDLTVPIRFSLR